MKEQTDLNQSLSKLIESTFINYRGRLIERMAQGFRWNNQCFYTIEELDLAINRSLKYLENSLK